MDDMKKTVEIPKQITDQLNQTKTQYESIIRDLNDEVNRLKSEITALREKTSSQLSMKWGESDSVEGDFAKVFSEMIIEHERKLDQTIEDLEMMCLKIVEKALTFIGRLISMKSERSRLLKPLTKG